MTNFIQFRIKISKLIVKYSTVLEKVIKGIIAFITLQGILRYFNYVETLDHIWLVLLLTAVCAFVTNEAMALICALFLLAEIFGLSLQGGIIVAAIMLIIYCFCRVFIAKQYFHLSGLSVFYQMHLTFLLPTEAALFGEPVEVIPLIGGTAIAVYLRQLRDNATALTEGSESVTPFTLLQSGVLGNQLFYLYLASAIVLFVVISVIRIQPIRYAGILAVTFGVLAEFIIMLAGYLLLNSRDRIPNLVICNIVCLIVGIISSYLVLDLDYSRVEKVRFEDDEYYYYVVAVPKVKVSEDQKEVKKITRKPGGNHHPKTPSKTGDAQARNK